MKGDLYTKALQGKLFTTHRKTLMGLDEIEEYQFYQKYKKQRA